MKLITSTLIKILLITMLMSASSSATESSNSTIVNRAELSKYHPEGMEVISSISEYQPGESIKRHFHHGIEAAYIIQGGMVQAPNKDPMLLKTGVSLLNLRDIPHAGFTVVGEHAIKLFTVHIVDKGKTLYEWTE